MPSGYRAAETTVIYPYTGGGFQPCRGCWRCVSTIAWSLDPRDHQPKPLCRTCRNKLVCGNPLPPLTGEVWEDLARLHQNREIANADVAAALRDHAGHLTAEDGWAAIEVLTDALLRLQAAEDPSTVLDVALTGPEFDAETYVIDCRGHVLAAVLTLVGRRM